MSMQRTKTTNVLMAIVLCACGSPRVAPAAEATELAPFAEDEFELSSEELFELASFAETYAGPRGVITECTPAQCALIAEQLRAAEPLSPSNAAAREHQPRSAR